MPTNLPIHIDNITMEGWGEGMLQTSIEYEEIKALDELLGLRELRAKINGRAGITHRDVLPNRFSISAEFNYGTNSIEITRKYIDSLAMPRLLEVMMWDTDKPESIPSRSVHDSVKMYPSGAAIHRAITVVACLVSLGCQVRSRGGETADGWILMRQIDPEFVEMFHQRYPEFARSALAVEQLIEAMDRYEDGRPYHWANKTLIEAKIGQLLGGTTTGKETGSTKVVEVTLASGHKIPCSVAPPTDEELGLQPVYPADVCAHCGKDYAEDGTPLKKCSRCDDRLYCSRQCQKEHWNIHKIICLIPANDMAAFLNSISLDEVKKDSTTERKNDKSGPAKSGL